jgi:hypothetical protein
MARCFLDGNTAGFRYTPRVIQIAGARCAVYVHFRGGFHFVDWEVNFSRGWSGKMENSRSKCACVMFCTIREACYSEPWPNSDRTLDRSC